MNKYFLILNLIIKAIVDFIIVSLLVLPVGVVVFIIVYLYYSIQKAFTNYHTYKRD